MDEKWRLGEVGAKFHNGKGTVRELVAVTNRQGPASKWVIHWKRVAGEGSDEGTCKWSSWRAWVTDVWIPPRPEKLPVPEVSDVEFAFNTGKHTPRWSWVPNEFKAGGKPDTLYENRHNPWCKVTGDLSIGTRSWADWKALPKEGIDPRKAYRAIIETMGSWGIKHEAKVATTAYMLSEWFEDCWFEGDTRTRIGNLDLATLFEEEDSE